MGIPNLGGGLLARVDVASPSDAWGVGTVIARRNGTVWNVAPSPNLGTFNLVDVVATSPSDAWAVGSYDASPSQVSSVIAHWDGALWTPVTHPNLAGPRNSVFTGVAATSPSDAWAVGWYDNGTVDRTLIEHWNGTVWSSVPSPNLGGASSDNRLNGVAAISPTNAWAVGSYTNPTTQRFYATAIAHWDGSVWTPVTHPNQAGTDDNELMAVAATSASNVWAVGQYFVSAVNAYHILIEHWDGTAWHWVTVQNPFGPIRSNYLDDVAATPSDAWAVGWTDNGTGGIRGRTLALHWTGCPTSLSAAPTTMPGA